MLVVFFCYIFLKSKEYVNKKLNKYKKIIVRIEFIKVNIIIRKEKIDRPVGQKQEEFEMISKYSVKKPYTVLVAVVLVIVLGVVSLSKMTTDLLPDMSFQYALIITTDVGASPEEVESDVTSPIESAMATTSNIKNVGSMSYNSYSIVTCEYEQNANMDSVVIEIQQALDQLSAGWDDNIGSPTIMKINPDMLPIMMAAVDVDDMDASEITDYIQNDIIPSIESLEGVASVNATGALEENVYVTLNEDKIEKLNKKIQKAIKAQFADAQAEIDSASDEVKNNQSNIDSSGTQIEDAIKEVESQKSKLYKTESDLNEQLKTLKSQKKSLEQVQSGINEFIKSEVYTTTIPQLTEAIESLESGIQQMKAIGADTKDMEKQLKTAKESLKAINAEIKKNFSGLSEMGIKVKTYEDLPKASKTVGSMLTKINTGIKSIEEGLEQVESGKVKLSDAMDTLNSNAALAAIKTGNASAQLATAASSLEQAQSELDSSKESALESSDINTVLSMDTLSNLIVAQNFDMPAGYAKDGDDEYLVRVGNDVESVEELEDLVLIDMGLDDIDAIKLSDVADVEIQDNSDENYAVVNGNPGIILSMEKQTGYSTGEVTDRLLDKFESLEKEHDDTHFNVLMNQGIYIDMVVDSVMQNMIFGGILAIFVLLLFLKDIKPTIIIACSIPLSVVAAVVLMYFTDISLNIISMSGLVLGIGMLVDNSIVVIENIYRLRNEGYSVKKAAVEGASQVTGAIIASTLTTISVYAPIIFTEGITRQLFVDLALTIAFTLIASLVVALTFVPAASSAILKNTKEVKHPLFDKFKEVYGNILEVCLRYKVIVFIVAILLLVGSASLAVSRGMTFMDMDMESNQLSVTIEPLEGEKLEFDELTDLSDEVIGKISDIEGIETIGATAGGSSTASLMNANSDSVSMYIILDEERNVSAKEISDEIIDRTKDMKCQVSTDSSAMDTQSFFGNGISVQIKGDDLEKLQSLSKDVVDILENVEGTTEIEDGLDDAIPQLTITVDKEKAAKYGYTVAQVYQLVYGKMATTNSTTNISTDIKDYKVYIQKEDQVDTTLKDIKDLKFTYKNKEGKEKEIPLTKICKMENTTTLSTINRDAQTRYITVSCGIDEDHNVTLISNKVQKQINKLDIPEGYSIEMKGEDETINDSMEQLMLMLVLAVVFIYLIMVAQFQSLLSPFIIMFSIPLAFTGGFIALYISGLEISVISMLGFIMLAGLIVNNGIVLIDYINQARREGESKHDAIIESGKTRLRPILMTALTTILAMSTSAVGFGEGSDMMKPMAITIIGGLVYGTILTLIVIPCIYDAFNREKSMVEEEL